MAGGVGGKLTGDLGKAEREGKKLAQVKLREYVQEVASDALGSAADKFAEASRAAFGNASPESFKRFAREGRWRGGVRARPYKKNVRISVMALAAHDLAQWNRGKIRAPFFGDRARWHEIARPQFRGTSTKIGRQVGPESLSELGTSVAQLLTDRLS